MEKINWNNISEKFTTLIFYLSILFFLIAFNFQDSKTGGWYQQWLPTSLGNAPVKDMVFTDSLTGYIIAGSPYLLKTTNGGDNWFVNQNFGDTVYLRNIQSINKDSIIICEGNSIYKSTNEGLNWTRYFFPGYPYNEMGAFWMHALNFDSIWIACGTGFNQPQLYLTTNGGISWTLKFQLSSGSQFDKVYFYNKNIGFCCTYNTYKTTNGGENWSLINSNQIFTDIYFNDSLTGWKSRPYKTTDGGLTWIDHFHFLPQTFEKGISRFSKFNKDTIWGVGGTAYYGGGFSNVLGIVYKTTNNGLNWGYQQPDTNIRINKYYFCNFINHLNGWSYFFNQKGIHTKVGGNDTTFFTNIKEQIANISFYYELGQNFPNPFNPVTKIKYSIKNSVSGIQYSEVKLIVYNIVGKEITTLVNNKQIKGDYEVRFDGSNLSSGVYFYTLFADGVRIDTKKMVLLK